MNSIDILNQANLADSLGKFRIADKLYEKAFRLAAGVPPPAPVLDAVAKEAIEAALREALSAGSEAEIKAALRRLNISESTIEALEKAHPGFRNVNTQILLNEVTPSIVERAASTIFIDGKPVKLTGLNGTQFENLLNKEMHAEERRRLVEAYRRYLNRNTEEIVSEEFASEVGRKYTSARPARPRTEPTPEPTPGPEPTPETPITEVLPEEGGGLFSKLFRKKPKNVETELPKQKSKLIKWAKGLTAAALLTYGLILVGDKLYHKDGKKEINYLDPDWNRLGLPDFRMYNDRMEAGQQKAQEPKALAFIEKHKDNPAIKDQRDWYNLALQEGKKEGDDPKTVKNFANDVIAIIKKSPLTPGFNADRNAPRS